eukprot:6190722-Pleurochrysis_carterae.AAC.1
MGISALTRALQQSRGSMAGFGSTCISAWGECGCVDGLAASVSCSAEPSSLLGPSRWTQREGRGSSLRCAPIPKPSADPHHALPS